MKEYFDKIIKFMSQPKILFLLVCFILIAAVLIKLHYNNSSQMGGENHKTTFILYYVDWCPHCRTVKPEWDKLEKDKELNKKVTIKKINCEENESAVEEKGIESFPTILLNNNGKEVGYDGGREYDDFKKYLESLNL